MRRVLWTTTAFLFVLALAPTGSLAMHHETYETECAKCHGDDGTADTPVGKAMKVPSFVGSEWAEADPAAICDAVRANAKHKAIVGKLDDEALMASCRKVKDLAGSGS
jgi:mono/diheme cytochrome c family protein